jgi:hypothetical protein
MLGRGQGRLDLVVPAARDQLVGDVGIQVSMDARRVGGQRGLASGDARQRRVLHGDQVERVTRQRGRGGQHRRDRLAHVAHLVNRQRRLGRHPQPGQRAGDALEHQVGHVGASQRVDHAWHPAGQLEIDRREPRVRVWTAQHAQPQRIGQPHVVDVAALTPQQPRILDPPPRLPDHQGSVGKASTSVMQSITTGRSAAKAFSSAGPRSAGRSTRRPRQPIASATFA